MLTVHIATVLQTLAQQGQAVAEPEAANEPGAYA
jgi:hypothetical protein